MKTLAVLSCLLFQVIIYQPLGKSIAPDYNKPVQIQQDNNVYRGLGKSIAPDYNHPTGRIQDNDRDYGREGRTNEKD